MLPHMCAEDGQSTVFDLVTEPTAGPSAAADQPSNEQPSAASTGAEESEPAERQVPQGETHQTRSRVTPHAQRAAEAPAAPTRVTRSCRGRVAAEAEGPAVDLQQIPLSQAFPSPPRVRGRRCKKAKPAKEASPVPAAAAEAPAQLEVVPAEQDSAEPEDMEVAEPRSMQQEEETQVTLHGWQFVHIAECVRVIRLQLQVSCAWLHINRRSLASACTHCALGHSAVLPACMAAKPVRQPELLCMVTNQLPCLYSTVSCD